MIIVPKLFSKPCGFGAALSVALRRLEWAPASNGSVATQSSENADHHAKPSLKMHVPAGVGQLIESMHEFSAYLDAESEFTQLDLSEHFRRKDSRLAKSLKKMEAQC